MKVELISNWQNPQIVDMVDAKAYKRVYQHFVQVLHTISKKPETKVELSCCMEPYLSCMALDAFIDGHAAALDGYAPAEIGYDLYRMNTVLEDDTEKVALMNQRFLQFAYPLGDALVRVRGRVNSFRASICWCSGGVADTWRMSGFKADWLLCYSFDIGGPDDTCLAAWDRSEAKHKENFNIERVLAQPVVTVDPIRRRKKRTTA